LHAVSIDCQGGGDASVAHAVAMQLPDAPLGGVAPAAPVEDVARPGLVVGAVLHALDEATLLGLRVFDRVEVSAVRERAVGVARRLQVLEAGGGKPLGPLAT